jgi:hypothetical protein
MQDAAMVRPDPQVVDRQQFAQLAALDNAPQLDHCRVEAFDVADGDHPGGGFRPSLQLTCGLQAIGDRLLDQQVAACVQRIAGDLVMQRGRGCNGDQVRALFEQGLVIRKIRRPKLRGQRFT